jgi:membrane-associated phospholipid phosphatase
MKARDYIFLTLCTLVGVGTI